MYLRISPCIGVYLRRDVYVCDGYTTPSRRDGNLLRLLRLSYFSIHTFFAFLLFKLCSALPCVETFFFFLCDFTQAKRSRLRDLETRIEETQTEMTHLTEAIRTEQQKAVEGIRAEERKTACLKQKEEILRALSHACRQRAARSSSSSLAQRKRGEKEEDDDEANAKVSTGEFNYQWRVKSHERRESA